MRGLDGCEPTCCGTKELEEANSFKYLGSELGKDGGINIRG